MQDTIRDFLDLATFDQIKFLKSRRFTGLAKKEKIEFLKSILKLDLSSKTIATSLRTLRELKYRDKFYFRKFLYHSDSFVSNAAKKAVSESVQKRDSGAIKMIEMLRKEKSEERVLHLRTLIENTRIMNLKKLIALLDIYDIKMREIIVNHISSKGNVKELKLVEAIKGGAVWFKRAALIEILGNRKSELLYDLGEFILNDKNVEVKLNFIKALSKLDGDKTKIYLEKLKNDPNIWVSKRAKQALEKGVRS